MKNLLILAFLLCASSLFAQTHSNTLTCTAGTTGGAPTSFNFKMSLVKGGPYAQVGTSTAPACTFTDSQNMVEGQTRFYVVTAVNSKGESGPSNEVSATTPFSAPDAPALTVVSK